MHYGNIQGITGLHHIQNFTKTKTTYKLRWAVFFAEISVVIHVYILIELNLL